MNLGQIAVLIIIATMIVVGFRMAHSSHTAAPVVWSNSNELDYRYVCIDRTQYILLRNKSSTLSYTGRACSK